MNSKRKLRFLFAASLATLVVFCGGADHRKPRRPSLNHGARRGTHRATRFYIRQPSGRQLPSRVPKRAAEPHDPFGTALLHPDELQDHEVAWFRSQPEARERLLARLAQPAIEDDDPARILLWTLLEKQVLMPSEIAAVLDQAFNLVAHKSRDKTWWLFRRRTAPQFVYVRPQMWVLVRDGTVVRSEAANTPGNGVEVHAESEGAGPFAGVFPVDDEGSFLADEFRLYYKVTYAPGMKWLEGFKGYLQARLPKQQ